MRILKPRQCACRLSALVLALLMLIQPLSSPAYAAGVGSFGDISSSDWYYDAVSFVVEKGLFQGTSASAFSPGMAMTRGMFITVLGRYASVTPSDWCAGTVSGSGVNLRSGPDTSYSVVSVLEQGSALTIQGRSGEWYQVKAGGNEGYIRGDYVSARYHEFTDVSYSAYYAGYATWAYEQGIVTGDGSADRFSPMAGITREQACTILSRFAQVMGLSLNKTGSSGSSGSFADDGKISSWARDSVYAMQSCGVVNGRNDGNFDPYGSTTRAEAAAMLQRFNTAVGGYVPPASKPDTGEQRPDDGDEDQEQPEEGEKDPAPPQQEDGGNAAPPTPEVPDPGAVADTPATIVDGAVYVPSRTIRVGLFVSTQSFSSCVSEVTLTNSSGSGFDYGYMDSGRSFVSQGSIDSATVRITTDGSAFTVTDSQGNIACTYEAPLALHPVGGVTCVNGGYSYSGSFELRQAYYVPGKITVINYVDVEDYVKGVIPYEFSAYWPLETLKAAAITSRSHIVAANWNAYAQYGMDIVAEDGSQLYRGVNGASATSNEAVDATRNLYMTYNGSICSGYFSSSDGGATEDSSHIFGTNYGYLVGKLDPYEQAAKDQISNYTYSITNARTGSTMKNLASSLGLGTIAKNGIRVNTYPATGNVESVTITDENGKSATVGYGTSVDRWGFLSKFGFTAYSYRFSVVYDEGSDSFTCTRLGWGHNVGMSQWGAYAMAQYYGKNYQQILGFYFTNIHLQYGA